MEEFDQIVGLQHQYYEQGFNDGLKEGLQHNKDNLEKEAIANGTEIGEELGYYKGITMVYSVYMTQIDPKKQNKLEKLIKDINQTIDKFSLLDYNQKQIDEEIMKIRNKVKLMAKYMGMKYRLEQQD